MFFIFEFLKLYFELKKNYAIASSETMNQEASVKIGKKFAALDFEVVERISTEEQSKYERKKSCRGKSSRTLFWMCSITSGKT